MKEQILIIFLLICMSCSISSANRWYTQNYFIKKITPYRTGAFRDNHEEMARKNIDKLLKFAEFTPGGRIMDLGCGEGYHAASLSKLKYKMTGLDANEFMISKATETFKRLGCKISLKKLDMSKWEEREAYDAIVSFGHSFGCFETQAEGNKILDNIFISLKPGGKFFIEVYGKEIFERVYKQTLVKERNGTTLVRLCEILNGYEKFRTYFYFLRGGTAEVFKVESFIYSSQELQNLLKKAGFKIIGVYGNYDQDSYGYGSESLMILAEKPI